MLQQRNESRIRFVLFGDGIEGDRLRQQVASLALNNVEFKGRVPPEAIAAELDAADALLVHLADEPVFAITIPSKTQAYLARADSDGCRRGGCRYRCGCGGWRCCKALRPASIADAALELARCGGDRLNKMGEAARSITPATCLRRTV